MITIVQGEDREISFGLKDINEDVYIDLTGATQISFKVLATSGGSVECLLSAAEVVVTDAIKGKFKVVLSDTKSALIKLGERDIEVTIDWGTTRRIVQSTKAITVVKRLF
jgi:hypothetical protein